eukprot:g5335.t1
MHSVFQRATLAQNCKSKVESVAASPNGDRIFAGCADGSLLVFNCDLDAAASASTVPRFHLFDTHKKWCGEKRAITCLAAIGEWGVTLSICDGYMYVHNLATLELITKLRSTRNCSRFCIDASRSKVCVSIKHRLLVLTWTGKELANPKELHTPSTARSLQWIGNHLCVGFRREYNLLSVETGLIIKEVTDTGRKEKPLVTLVDALRPGDDPEFLISNDSKGIFMDYMGSPSRKPDEHLDWSSIPSDACCLHPYIVALVNNSVQIHNLSTLQLAETVPLSGCKSLCLTRLPFAGAKSDESIAGPGLRTILIAASSSVHAFYVLPLGRRIEQLLSTKQYEAALMLCDVCGDSAERKAQMSDEVFSALLNKIHMGFAEHLFRERKFSRAREEFFAAECDPRVVLALFPDLLPEGLDLSSHYISEDETKSSVGSAQSGVQQLVGHEESNSTGNLIDRSAVTNLLIPFLILVRRQKWGLDHTNISDSEAAAGQSRAERIAVQRQGQGGTVFLDEIVDTVLLNAYIVTNAPLVDVVDFLMSGGSQAGSDNPNVGFDVGLDMGGRESLFRGDYECRALVDESEKMLQKYPQKWEELIWFYFSRGLHQKALDWLQDAHRERDSDIYPDQQTRAEKTVEYLQRLLEVAAAEQLRTKIPVVSRSHTRLVLEYSKWILAFDPSLGLKIFAAFIYTDPIAAIAINPADVLKHLEQSLIPESSEIMQSNSDKRRNSSNIGSRGKKKSQVWHEDQFFKTHPSTCSELCVCFLENLLIDLPHAIAANQSKERRGSTGNISGVGDRYGGTDVDRRGGRRISILASRTLRLRVARRSEKHNAMLQNRLRHITSDETLHNKLALHFLNAIDESGQTGVVNTLSSGERGSVLQPPSTTKTIAREKGKRGSLRRRLLSFLQTSKFYQAQAFLTKFQATRLYEERAVLLQRAGRHEEALKIYVHDMGSLDMATAYCEQVSLQQQQRKYDMKVGSDSVASVGGSLRSFDSEQDVFVMLLRTCLKQPATQSSGKRLPGWAGGRNEAMLAPALRILNEHSAQIDPVQALSLLPQSTPQHNTLQSRYAILTDDMTCGVCGRPFSTLSAPAIYPNMSVVHVACAQRACKCGNVLWSHEKQCGHCFDEIPSGAPLDVDPITGINFPKRIKASRS